MEYRVTITECTDRGEQEPLHAEMVTTPNGPNEAARIANAHSEGLGGTKRLYRIAVQIPGEIGRWIAWAKGDLRIDIYGL